MPCMPCIIIDLKSKLTNKTTLKTTSLVAARDRQDTSNVRYLTDLRNIVLREITAPHPQNVSSISRTMSLVERLDTQKHAFLQEETRKTSSLVLTSFHRLILLQLCLKQIIIETNLML